VDVAVIVNEIEASFRLFVFHFELEQAPIDHRLLEAVVEKELGMDLVPDFAGISAPGDVAADV
jgi:hypothetical protein